MIWLIILLISTQESPGSEIGDAVFRILGYMINSHTAVYRNSLSYGDWDGVSDIINSDFGHSVIQASGFGDTVGVRSFAGFLSGYQQIGYCGWSLPPAPGLEPFTTEKRKMIIQAARRQYGAVYPPLSDWRWPFIKYPREIAQANGETGFYKNGSFRCDGLVEYAYEYVVNTGNPDPDDNGFFRQWEEEHCLSIFTPDGLRYRMSPEVPTPPEVEVVSPEEGEDVEDNIHIEFTADDGEYGSGIDVVYVYVDNELVYRDDEDSDGEKGVEYDYDASGLTEGNHYVKISVYDRAGNLREEEIKVYKGEAPYVVLVYPIGGGIPIDCGRVWINFSTPMNRASVEGAVSMEPSVAWTANWLDDKTVVFNFSEYLDYCETYMVTITDNAMSVDSVRLDDKSLPKNFNMYRIS